MNIDDINDFPKREKKKPLDLEVGKELEQHNWNVLRINVVLGFSCNFCSGGQIIDGRCEDCGKSF